MQPVPQVFSRRPTRAGGKFYKPLTILLPLPHEPLTVPVSGYYEMKNDFVLEPLTQARRVRCGRLVNKGNTGTDNMKHSSQLLISALTLVSSVWITTAQPTNDPPPEGGPLGGPGMGHRRFPPPPFIAVLDANRDGVIDADEIANATAALKKLDKNGDGQLTLDELLAPPPGRRGGTNDAPPPDGFRPPPPGEGGAAGHPPVPPIIAALDANGDGVIDADELANAPAALKKLDKNGDGKLTPDEFRPPRPGGPGMPPPHGDAGGPPPGDGPDNPPPPPGDQ